MSTPRGTPAPGSAPLSRAGSSAGTPAPDLAATSSGSSRPPRNPPLPISQTPLHPRYQAYCRRASLFNVAQVIAVPPPELAQILHLSSVEEAERVGRGLAAFVLPRARCLGGEGGDENAGKEEVPSDGQPRPRRRRPATHLRTGDARLDDLMRGGIRLGMLTELVGESATGKSQLAMQLAVHTALGIRSQDGSNDGDEGKSGEEGAVCDVDPGSVALMLSEGDTQCSLFVQRMVQIADDVVRRRFRARSGQSKATAVDRPAKRRKVRDDELKEEARSPSDLCPYDEAEDEEEAVRRATAQLLQNIHLASIRDMDALEHVVDFTIPALAHRLSARNRDVEGDSWSTSSSAPMPSPSSSPSSQHPQPPPLKLVILDNLPSLLYATHPSSFNAMVARSRALCTTSDGLKRLATFPDAHDDGCAVLVVNHVSDVFDRDLDAVKPIVAAVREGGGTKQAGQPQPQPQPPLSYSQQAPFFSGLLDSYAATEHTLRMANAGADANVDAGMEELSEDSIAGTAAQAAKQAALGHVWNNCVNARLMLCRTRVIVDEPQHDPKSGWDCPANLPRICLRHAPPDRDDHEHAAHDMKLHPTPTGSRHAQPLRVANLIFAPDAPPSHDASAGACYYVLERRGLRSLPIAPTDGGLQLCAPRSPEDVDLNADLDTESASLEPGLEAALIEAERAATQAHLREVRPSGGEGEDGNAPVPEPPPPPQHPSHEEDVPVGDLDLDLDLDLELEFGPGSGAGLGVGTDQAHGQKGVAAAVGLRPP